MPPGQLLRNDGLSVAFWDMRLGAVLGGRVYSVYDLPLGQFLCYCWTRSALRRLRRGPVCGRSIFHVRCLPCRELLCDERAVSLVGPLFCWPVFVDGGRIGLR